MALFVVSGWAAAARAETCPEIPDEEVALRRSMAKEWFAKAEEAEASGDRQGAVRRYACSLGLAPHPSTAYNLGTVAEKSGDLSMAVDGFRTYLKLSPEATDRPSIEARIATLEAKIADLRKNLAPKADPVAPPSAAPAAVTPAAATPHAPTEPTAPAPTRDDGRARRITGLSLLGGAGVAVAAGVVLNLKARAKMNDCYKAYAKTPEARALDLCDDAKPFAYGSYALFGAGGVLAVVGTALLVLGPDTAEAGTEVGFVPTSGGAAFVASGRF